MLAETLGLSKSSLMNRGQRQGIAKRLKEIFKNEEISAEATFNLYKRCTYSRARKLIAERLALKIEELSVDRLLSLSLNPPTKTLGLKFFEALKAKEYTPAKYIEQVAAWSKSRGVKDAAIEYLKSLEICDN